MKKLSKLLAIILCLAMAASLLSACGGGNNSSDNNSGGNTPSSNSTGGDNADSSNTGNDADSSSDTGDAAEPSGDPIQIGVLVADVSGAEALAFRDYYEKYIAANYNVTFTYTEQLTDAAGEKSAIEKFAAQGYDAIISMSSSDRATQIETCAANGLYYAIASGMLDDDQYEQYKGEEYFVGQIGPSMQVEYETGVALGQYYAGQGMKTVGMYGAFIPNPMHVYRAAGIIVGLGDTYGGASDMGAIVGQIFGDQGVDVNKIAGDVQIVGYLQGYDPATSYDALYGILGQGPDAFLSVGMTTTFFASNLNETGFLYGDIDSFTADNQANMTDGSLTYIAGKYASSIGPIFAAVVNAVNGNPVRSADGSALSITQGYQVATDTAAFETYLTGDQANPIFNKDVLDTVIGSGVTYDDFAALVESH